MLERLFDHLQPLIRAVVWRPVPLIGVSLVLAALGGWGTMHLQVDSDSSRLIPSDYVSVQALERLREQVGGAHEASVIIESPSFEANRQFAEALIPRALRLRPSPVEAPYVTRVDHRRDVSFLEAKGLYLATPDELDSLQAYLERESRQATLEANPFYFNLEEDDDAAAAEAIEQQLGVLREQLVSHEYPTSDDSTALAVRFYPSDVQTDIAFIRSAYRDLEARAGRHVSARVLATEAARMPVTALVIGVPLLTSLAWTFGLAYLTLGALNMMTSTLGLVLFGLGIDFGIHFYARYAEERGEGQPPDAAAERTFMTTGQAITGVGLTTAAAFFILMLADFKGGSEFGFIAGLGLLFAIVTMTLMLPALVVWFERMGLLRLVAIPAAPQPPPKRAAAEGRLPGARIILVLSLAAVGWAVWAAPHVQFEYDFGELDPEYEEYAPR